MVDDPGSWCVVRVHQGRLLRLVGEVMRMETYHVRAAVLRVVVVIPRQVFVRRRVVIGRDRDGATVARQTLAARQLSDRLYRQTYQQTSEYDERNSDK